MNIVSKDMWMLDKVDSSKVMMDKGGTMVFDQILMVQVKMALSIRTPCGSGFLRTL